MNSTVSKVELYIFVYLGGILKPLLLFQLFILVSAPLFALGHLFHQQMYVYYLSVYLIRSSIPDAYCVSSV